jgi:cell division septation protein DedD
MAERRKKEGSGRLGWASFLTIGAIVVAAGFAVGIVAGISWEEPRLVLGYLTGETEGLDWGVERLASSPKENPVDPHPVAAAPPPLGVQTAPVQEPSKPAERVAKPAKPAKTKSPSAPLPAAGAFSVQVGAFSAEAAANTLADSLRGRGFDVYVSRGEGDPASWRVRVGPLPSREHAERAADRLKKSEKLDTWILSEAS